MKLKSNRNIWKQLVRRYSKKSSCGTEPIVAIFAGRTFNYTSYLDVHWPIAIQFRVCLKVEQQPTSHDSLIYHHVHGYKLPVGAHPINNRRHFQSKYIDHISIDIKSAGLPACFVDVLVIHV